MAIDFSVNDIVRVVASYVTITLNLLGTTGKTAAAALGSLGSGPGTVTATGIFDGVRFIKILPQNTRVSGYRSGRGTIIYFSNDTQLNNSFELSTAFLCDIKCIKVQNNTAGTLSKSSVVYHTGSNRRLIGGPQPRSRRLSDTPLHTSGCATGVRRKRCPSSVLSRPLRYERCGL